MAFDRLDVWVPKAFVLSVYLATPKAYAPRIYGLNKSVRRAGEDGVGIIRQCTLKLKGRVLPNRNIFVLLGDGSRGCWGGGTIQGKGTAEQKIVSPQEERKLDFDDERRSQIR